MFPNQRFAKFVDIYVYSSTRSSLNLRVSINLCHWTEYKRSALAPG